MELWRLSASKIQALTSSGELSPVEVTRAFLDRIDALDGRVGAFLTVDRDGALARASELERSRSSRAAPGPLFGVPVALKDIFAVPGWETTCASKILAGYRAPYAATAVERLLRAGAVPLGRTNMDEFAMGSSTENSSVRPTRNPWDLARTPGGSSGGSAAAVAARMAPIALGTDTGGSIRQPAAMTGIHGLKPTYGRVSRYGLVAFASSLDQIGPFGRTTEDVALCLSVIAGHDPKDATSIDRPVPDYRTEMAKGANGLRIGVPDEYLPKDLAAEVRAPVEAAIRGLEKAGATVKPVRLPHTPYAIPTYYLICTSEASSNLSRFDGVRYGLRAKHDGDLTSLYARTRALGFGAEVKRRILLGTFCLSSGYYDAYYLKALKVRTLLRRDFDEAFAEVDVIVGPTSPVPAFRLGEKVDDPLAMYLCDVFAAPANLAGLPGISVPCGFTPAGLPIGLQILGPPLGEPAVLRAAAAHEAIAALSDKEPRL